MLFSDTGSLTMDEFLKLVGSRGLQTEREIHQDFEDALRFFDKDGRGLLDADELKSALQSFGEPLDDEDIAEMMRLADVKGDGRIDYLGKAMFVMMTLMKTTKRDDNWQYRQYIIVATNNYDDVIDYDDDNYDEYD